MERIVDVERIVDEVLTVDVERMVDVVLTDDVDRFVEDEVRELELVSTDDNGMLGAMLMSILKYVLHPAY